MKYELYFRVVINKFYKRVLFLMKKYRVNVFICIVKTVKIDFLLLWLP